MKLTHRLLSLLLALALLCSLIPTATFAVEVESEAVVSELQEEADEVPTESDDTLPRELAEDEIPETVETTTEPYAEESAEPAAQETGEQPTEPAREDTDEQALPIQEEETGNPTESAEAASAQTEELPVVPAEIEDALREQILEETAQEPSCASLADEVPYFENVADAISYVRSKAVERINVIDILVPEEVCQQLDLGELEDGCTDVLAHTGSPREGDFILGSLVYNVASAERQEDGRWKVEYYFAYWDSSDQIPAIEEAVVSLVQELDLSNNALSDYEKVKRIYDYITSHVTYAYEAMDAPNSHNAYGAFVEHYCVCQGYALMFYRLAMEAGLDSRYVTGNVGESHAWNIVKVDGVWYLVDATWDAGNSVYSFFLRGRTDFGHSNNDDNFHRIEGFADAYPISEFCYGKPDSYGTAPRYTLVTTDNRTVTTTAENGRAKVLLFFNDKCSFSTIMIQEMAKQEFPGVDIVAANFGNIDTLDLIGDFFPASFPGVYAECHNSTDAMRAFEDLTGITDPDGWSYSPTIFLINAKNQVIYGAHGNSGTLITDIQRLLVNPDAPPPAEDPVDYGSFRCMGVCGDNAVWRLYNNGTLRISGTGPLWDNIYSPNGMYWFEDVEDAYNNGAMKYANDSRPVEPFLYYNQVKRVVIEEGITYIGDWMFNKMDQLLSLEIPASVKTITHAADYRDMMVRQEADIYGWSNTAASAYAQKHGNRFFDLSEYPSTADYSSGGQLEEPPVLLKDYIPPVAEPNVYTLLTSDNREVKTKAEHGRGKVFVFYQTYYNNLLPDRFFQELNETEIPYADVLVIGNPDCLNTALSEAKKLIGTTYPASFPGSYILSNTSRPFYYYLSDKYSIGCPSTVIMDGDSNIVYAHTGVPENLPELVNSLVTHLGTDTGDGQAEDYGTFTKIGVCGDNAVWRYYDDGTLRISGSGPLWDNMHVPSSIGWADSGIYRETDRVLDFVNCTDVKQIIIDDGITYIGNSMFYGMDHLEDLYIPPSVIRYSSPMRYPVITHQNLTVYGIYDSAARQFAKDYQVKFVATDRTSIQGAVLNVASQTYTGKPIIPAVTLRLNGKTLKKGTDYTVSSSNNVKPGTATVTVTGKGNYFGTVKGTFTIKQLATPTVQTLQRVNGGVKVSIKKPAGAKAFRVFCKTGKDGWKKVADTTSTTVTIKKYSGKALQTGTVYRFTVRCLDKVGGSYVSGYNSTGKTITYVAAPTLSSVKNTKARTATAAWKKLTGVTGYQIQYSTSKTFASGNKSVTVKKAAATSQAITGLTKGKTYYFRIRSYKTVSGKAVYSAWSAAKSLKISK